MTWNGTAEASPADTDLVSAGAGKIRETRTGARERLAKEHVMYTSGSAGAAADDGWHLSGSAKAYFGGSEPTDRPDGATALDTNDAGRVWFDTSTNPPTAYVFNGSGMELFASSPQSNVTPTSVLLDTGSGTWTVPTDVTKIKVIAKGGGGAAGPNSSGYTWGPGGGGAGGMCIAYMTVTPGNGLFYSIGAGGSSGDGGDTTFDALTASGGKQGLACGSSSPGQGGAGGAASGGDLNFSGDPGNFGANYVGGNGGAGLFGAGAGLGGSLSPLPTAGAPNSGAGGGAKANSSSTPQDGGSGIIIIEY